jgi:hypothetical protein
MNLKYKYEVIQDYPAVSVPAPARPVINNRQNKSRRN